MSDLFMRQLQNQGSKGVVGSTAIDTDHSLTLHSLALECLYSGVRSIYKPRSDAEL